MQTYLTLDQLIDLIGPPNNERCRQLFTDHKARFEQAPGSLAKHQAWPGGYIDHLTETMNIAVTLYENMNFRGFSFPIGNALLVLFLHDLEKPFKYIELKHAFNSDLEKETFIYSLIKKYEITLTDLQKNALKYIHGEGDDYHPTERVQSPLAAFCHICDTWSARIWYDYPKHSPSP